MLKSIRLRNFKLHEDTSIEAAPITVFIGPNNSGKSSIFQALLALRQAAVRGRDWFLEPVGQQQIGSPQPYAYREGAVIDIGDYEDILRQGKDEIEIGVSGEVQSRTRVRYREPAFLDFQVAIRNNTLASHGGRIESKYGTIEWAVVVGAPLEPNTFPVSVDGYGFGVRLSPSTAFQLVSLSTVSFPPDWSRELQSDLVQLTGFLGHSPVQLLNSLHPIYPLRGFEEAGYPLPDYPPQSVEWLVLGDRTIAVASLLAYSRELEERLSDRLEQLLGMRIKVKLLPGKRVTLWAEKVERLDRSSLFINEGSGAHQLPFILVPIGLTPCGETILLSEPEAHLHPKAQCEVTRMLLTVAKKENIQFFIETHSEHVLHVILNAIGKHEWEPSQVAIYSFENVNGTAKATPLEVDEQGGVKGGLPGFFDQSLDELAEYLETLKKPSA